MKQRLTAIAAAFKQGLQRLRRVNPLQALAPLQALPRPALPSWPVLASVATAVLAAWALVQHPPMQSLAPGEVAVRSNQMTGSSSEFRDGTVWVLPALHSLRRLTLRDQLYRPTAGRLADGPAPFQSMEGLSLGVDLAVRYALDPARIASLARTLPVEIGAEVVEPAVQGVIYKVFTRYTVREIFATKRAEIQQALEAELRGKLAADGIVLKGVQIGKVDLPAEYRHGMERLLAEELASEKMQYTLVLKAKQVQQSELEAQADKVHREIGAAAAAREQIIAAQAQEEAMRHVLPFKQKQIEQRGLEAEADKVARIKAAEGAAQSRRIEAAGEADSRQKLADAEAYRIDRVGRISAEQMAREGVLLSRHPLLIQKTVADKLSDKIQVIIAPPGTDGRFIAAGLLGGAAPEAPAPQAPVAQPQAERE